MGLPPLVHFLVVALVVAAGDVVHPVLVVEVPPHGLLDALLKLERRLPAELALQLGAVDGVAGVVAQAVSHIGDKVHVLVFLAAQQTVNRANHHLDDVDVLPLVESADVVGLGNSAFVENQVDGAGVVLNEEPVAHVLALAIHGQRTAVAYVVDEERNQFLGELVWPVVVGAVGHDGGHAVGVVKSTHKVVAARLARRIG